MLTRTDGAGAAAEYLKGQPRTSGWNFLLADPAGTIGGVEVDGNFLNSPDGGYYFVTPDASVPANLDRWGRPVASVGPDDLRMASHNVRNTEDIDKRINLIFHVRPQRYWSSFYYRSLRAFSILGERIAERYGTLDAGGAIDILRDPNLVDHRDSMNAAVYLPASLRFYYAMGREPATDGRFRHFDLGKALGEARP